MLSTRQQSLILALLHSPTQRGACERAGVSEPCFYRWIRCPEFRQALDAARKRFAEESVNELARRSAAAMVAEAQPA